MNDFSIKFSDIFRYILLGCIESILCVVVLFDSIKSIDLVNVTNTFNAFTFDKSIIVLIVILSVFYIFGYITQLVISLFFHGNFLGTGIGETACFIKYYPKWIFNKEKYPFPEWIYYSEAPDKVVEVFQDITETDSESEKKLEFSYANQLFQGIALALISFTVFSLDLTAFIKTSILLALFIIFFILGCNATKNRNFIVANKILMYLFPVFALVSLLFRGGDFIDTYPLAALVSLIMLASLFLAGFLSRKQLRRIDILSHQKDEKLFDSTLVKYGVPCVYILTRVDETAFPFLREQFESIEMQDYPVVKVIVLIDKFNMSEASKQDAENLIEEFVKKGVKIQHSYSKEYGAAALAYETRQIFINYATDNDISICLDADDKLANPQVVSNIVSKMFRTQSNICIIGFETFGNTYLNFAKNYHNDLVKMFAKKVALNQKANSKDCLLERKDFLTPKELIDADVAHLVSTLGWVKCYRKPIAKAYQTLLSEYKPLFTIFPKYEDFPDIVALLSKDSKICAVAQTSIMFRKRAGSVTTQISSKNYDDFIPYYLELTDFLAHIADWKKKNLARNALNLIRTLFIPYKFVQYLNVIYNKTVINNELPDYSCTKFYLRFLDKIYSKDEEVFQMGIITILNNNRVNKIFDDLPKELAIQLEKRDLLNSEFLAIAEAYGIKTDL